MKFSLIIAALIMHYNIYSQNKEWLVKPGEDVKNALGDSVIYQYPQFKAGIVYFKNGTASSGNLNLNIFNGEMQFIQYSGDTMALADEGLIKYITIQNDTFYYNKVYVQLIYGNAAAKFGKIEVLKKVDEIKKSGYGQMTSTSSISNISYYGANNQVSKLEIANKILLHKETYYFIADRFNNFNPALKKNIFTMFNANKTAIETFMNDNNINLDKKEDLIKLIDFIKQIQQ
ncbi:hypothetical protein [Parafilimonas terrae]|uniref:Uncharacterized protein n=1 Tax=Parafilimonas terrae TaxID=1465490 RepID=A0A1I5RR02_9BACT|nr:hypothetical protein [Parafilimonas terrae]SFP60840.1 hypothetical protein SAMN05444277_101370 [Parafilimonas terrae]